MTEIELKEFKDKLNEVKYHCSSISRRDVDNDVVLCLRNLIDAVELLGDAVQNHYHSKDEDFEDLDEYED
jgi:hypothetical protein